MLANNMAKQMTTAFAKIGEMSNKIANICRKHMRKCETTNCDLLSKKLSGNKSMANIVAKILANVFAKLLAKTLANAMAKILANLLAKNWRTS